MGIPERVTVKDVERVLVTLTDLVRERVTVGDGLGERDRVTVTDDVLVNAWVEGTPESVRDNEVVRVRVFVIVCDTVNDKLFVTVGEIDRLFDLVRDTLVLYVADTVTELERVTGVKVTDRLLVIVGDTVTVFDGEEVYCREVGKVLNDTVKLLETVGLPVNVFETVAREFDAVNVNGKVVGSGLEVNVTGGVCVAITDELLEVIGEFDVATLLD